MITFYKNTENGLTVLTEPINNCWINVVDPTPEEVTRIQGLGVPADYITFPLDLNERARTERENGELLVILRIPFYQGETADIPYLTIPLGIILTDKYVGDTAYQQVLAQTAIGPRPTGSEAGWATGEYIDFIDAEFLLVR